MSTYPSAKYQATSGFDATEADHWRIVNRLGSLSLVVPCEDAEIEPACDAEMSATESLAVLTFWLIAIGLFCGALWLFYCLLDWIAHLPTTGGQS